MKSYKMATIGLTLFTGFLLVTFQNCGRLNIDVADLSASANKAVGSATSPVSDDVKIQIIEGDGGVFEVTENNQIKENSGIISEQGEKNVSNQDIVNVNSSVDNNHRDNSIQDEPVVSEEVKQPPIVVDNDVEVEDLTENNQPLSCKQFINRKGATLIDLANFNSVDELIVVKGFTVIFSTNDNQYIENLKISRGVGRTVICGVRIGQLKEKVGRLDLLDGAEILNMGSANGKLFKPDITLVNPKKSN